MGKLLGWFGGMALAVILSLGIGPNLPIAGHFLLGFICGGIGVAVGGYYD